MRPSTSTATRLTIPAPAVVLPPAKPEKSWLRDDFAIKLLVPLLLAAAFIMACRWGSFSACLQLLNTNTYSSWLPGLAAGYTLVMLGFQLLRTILWAGYKPHPLGQGPLPSLTVIIPAFNEGAMVEKAIYSVAAADYPAELLQIICIDDGSRDNTWLYIQRAQKRYPRQVKALRFPENRGKKAALYAGFTRGRGEVLVTVDSDSVIEPDALRHLVAPLQVDEQIGAVAGNVKVFNRHQSLIGKMQGVRFVNLDYLRAAQSRYRTVICTPGSLSAYRKSALLPYLEAWLHQTFLGAPCPHSEDRALTNFILRAGYYTCYQRTAVVYTLVPETYKGVCNMYLRWERGNVRESAVQLGYLFTRYRPKHRLLPMVEFCLSQLEYPLTLFFFALMLASMAVYPPLLFKLLALLGISSLLNLIYYLWLERDLEFVYGIIYSYYAFFLLQWIYPYAFATVRDRHWLTR
ncbi:MAG: glycosyltransferase [Deltaproteobacteria bacterium]|nr:glycosyltransferase [Deltaproteobacteria bacterium]